MSLVAVTDGSTSVMLKRMRTWTGPLLLTALALAGCAPPVTTPVSGQETAPASRAPNTPAHPRARGDNEVAKIVVFVVENKARAQMVRGLPWVARLGKRYGTTTNFHGIAHPSLPNYLAMASGATYGIEDDAPPSVHPLAGPSVFGAAIDAGKTARVYAESMARKCQTDTTRRYAVKHNPWPYFADEAELCAKHDVPFRRFAKDVTRGRLPTVAMVVPNMCHDAHDCRLPVANRWLRREIKRVLRGPDWAGGHLAIVVTADEDDRDHDQRILTVVAHPDLRHAVVDRYLDHYGLSRSYAEVAGVAPLGSAAGAASLLDAFNLVPSD